jgi:hypothetical protein
MYKDEVIFTGIMFIPSFKQNCQLVHISMSVIESKNKRTLAGTWLLPYR